MSATSRRGHDRHISLPDDIQAGLDEFFTTAKARLLCGRRITIEFPEGCSLQHWPAEEIERMNSETFGSLDSNGNLYAIFAGSGNGTWTPRYVGTISRGELPKRIKEHLVDNKGTHSKLAEVKCEVCHGSRIAISYVTIEPGNLREYIEKRIISEESKPQESRLSWNKRL